jgi:hypothetical protein
MKGFECLVAFHSVPSSLRLSVSDLFRVIYAFMLLRVYGLLLPHD